ncbi:hypothetical protein F511_16949 [Dorcoceras hygrometricum]|uniref:Uncharacterized protein n=1 Tax=Dorcoceras hygrometricum TaxID=472368 RepID=A0A2Z7CZR2_9LAMI|nr:hypothetical protein F511_16949 [Dorcoceras hygrometricum]
MLLSRSADTDLCFSVFLLRIGKQHRFDKLERRRGVHCFVSTDEVFSRYFVEEVQQLVKSICWRLRYDSVWKEERYKRDDEDNERNVEKSKDKSKDKFKERSSDRKMKTNNNKRFSRKHDRKVLVAEESTKSWADSDSDTSSSSSSSSESEQEEVHCFMADQTDEDESHLKPCCSNIFEGSPRDRGAVIARNNTITRSSCWIRTMIMVDGVWTVELCADKMMRKRWADVCLEVVEFCAKRLLPVGSTQFCRSLQLAEPVSSFAPSCPTVFALRFSQFCSVFIDLSLFSWMPSTDISEFLSSIALDRTILRSVQRSQDSFAVAPSVQLCLEQHQSSSSSSDSSSSLHFDQTDIDATASSRPTISPDFSAALADFQAALSEQMFAFQSEISSRMHKIDKSVCDSLRDQAEIFKNLSQGARQEVRTLDDVHTIRFNEFHKNVLTQNASIFQGLEDVQQVVDAVNAKVDIMAKRLNDIQKDAEATKEALSHQLLEFQSSAQENHNVIHTQLSELVDYIHRGSADKKGESGSRGLQKPANTQKEGSVVTPTFEQRSSNGSATHCSNSTRC